MEPKRFGREGNPESNAGKAGLFFAFALLSGLSFSAFAIVACADGDEAGGSSGATTSADASIERRSAAPTLGPAPAPSTQQIDAACNVVVKTEQLMPAEHVPENTVITYNSNPPSSGPHYPRWANFQEYPQPVPDGFLVHSLEHGAVLLLYKCTGEECATIQASLRKTRDEAVTDPLCDPAIRVRVIIAPRPDLDVPIAASAWGFTYKADCFDATSIAQFIKDHYGQAPENFCFAGATNF